MALMENVVEFIVIFLKCIYYWLKAIFMFFVPHSYFRKDISGQVVLITGAGSGLGKLLALQFAKLNCRLVLWDINGESINELASEIRPMGITCKTYTVDLSSREQIYKTAERVKEEMGNVDILVNNAGIVTGKKFLDCPDNLIQKTMEVNAHAHFWTVKAFLPAMLENNFGHIVSIASSAGLFGVTGLADYCASKYAAVGFDESLRYELAAMGKSGIHTTVVCPYYINTGMFEGVNSRILPILEQEYVIDKIMDAILCNQTVLIIPHSLYFAYAFKGILPTKTYEMVTEWLGVSKTMDTFVGRNPHKKSE